MDYLTYFLGQSGHLVEGAEGEAVGVSALETGQNGRRNDPFFFVLGGKILSPLKLPVIENHADLAM